MTDRTPEWPVRLRVANAALQVLASGGELSARDISQKLASRDLKVPKHLINSVLFSEARRYVVYNRANHKYSLRQVEPSTLADFSGVAIPSQNTSNCQRNNKRESQVSPREVGELTAKLLDSNREYRIVPRDGLGPAFFGVNIRGSEVTIELNSKHPAYHFARTALESNGQPPPDDFRSALDDAHVLVQALVEAWANYENSLTDPRQRIRAEEARIEWGRHLRQLLHQRGYSE
jgi:hypothetical protein